MAKTIKKSPTTALRLEI